MQRIKTLLLAGALAGTGLVAADAADAFTRIDSRDRFVSLVEGRALTSLGVRLVVEPTGKLAGRAFGRDVTGAWEWSGGFFCRTMKAGDRAFPRDCQLVQTDGRRVRFVAEQGEGDQAVLNLR